MNLKESETFKQYLLDNSECNMDLNLDSTRINFEPCYSMIKELLNVIFKKITPEEFTNNNDISGTLCDGNSQYITYYDGKEIYRQYTHDSWGDGGIEKFNGITSEIYSGNIENLTAEELTIYKSIIDIMRNSKNFTFEISQ